MNLLGRIASVYVPSYFKRRGLRTLFEMTASAFGAEMPHLGELSYDERIERYALFTKSVVDYAVQNLHDLGLARRQLCRGACDLGDQLRKRFGVSSNSDVMVACRIVYRCIGIDFRGTDSGDITICKCMFSNYYSEQTCGIVSCLDKGLLAGLSHGGKLNFKQRITEGMDCCKAEFTPTEDDLEIRDRRGFRSWWCNCC